jgi:hypothetical protein
MKGRKGERRGREERKGREREGGRREKADEKQIAETYNWNDNAQMKLNDRIKNELDPKAVLTSGKNGIWPRGYDREVWRLDNKSSVGAC